jgi:hypothetical protein
MKNLINAAGILSAGLASLALATSAYGQDSSKRWTVGAGVRGFFDDNIFTRPDITVGGVDQKVDSFGFDIAPTISYNVPLSQGNLDLGYTYGLRWFENRPGDNLDQYHNFNGAFSHNFSPRYKLSLAENFAMSQEPEQMAAVGGGGLIPFRTEGDNIRNSAGAVFTAQLAGALSGELNYNNNYYNYDNIGFEQALNRLEHLFGLNLRYQFRPTTVGVVGYQYGIFDYTSKALTQVSPTIIFNPQSKDQNSHFIYAGGDHNFTSRLLGSFRVGAQIAEWDDYTNLGVKSSNSTSTTTPYADASLSYSYADGSSVRIGVKHQRNATDLFDESINPILDTEATTAYLSVSHKITAKLNISGSALFQNAKFNAAGTSIDGENEQYWNLGVTVSYAFTRYLAGEASYYYDNLDSSLFGATREYDRNRVFLGVRFTY